MRLVVQRVKRGRVTVAGVVVADIHTGLVILVGVEQGDGEEQADWLATKCAALRIFDDPEGKMNLSLTDVHGEALVVSQFTLLADIDKGRRPSFVRAAGPQVAEPLVERFATQLMLAEVPTKAGRFGAHMVVEIENDGPVTILMEKKPPGGCLPGA
jgi:D-tyrosyl-tRNA(Tyr) deacylase